MCSISCSILWYHYLDSMTIRSWLKVVWTVVHRNRMTTFPVTWQSRVAWHTLLDVDNWRFHTCPIIPLTWLYTGLRWWVMFVRHDYVRDHVTVTCCVTHVTWPDMTNESDIPWVALFYDTTSLALRLSVNETWPSELCTKLRFRWPLTSHKSIMKPKFKNPARSNLDIVP